MKNKLTKWFCIIFMLLIVISGCNYFANKSIEKVKKEQNEQAKIIYEQQRKQKQDYLEEFIDKYRTILVSDKLYKDMTNEEGNLAVELVSEFEKNSSNIPDNFKNKYSGRIKAIEQSITDYNNQKNAKSKEKNSTQNNSNSNTELSKRNYKARFGQFLECNINGSTAVVKFKIQPSTSNKTTIHQNGYNIEDMILNQGADQYDEIQYWAVADMEDGSESKVISFTVDKDLITKIKNQQVVGNQIVDCAKDVWILPSLKQ